MNRLIPILALSISTLLLTGQASAQGYAVYSVVQPEYSLGSFRVYPPNGDGWRQVSNETSVLRLVYAEIVEDSTINTRADIVGEAFPIPDPELVPNALRLTLSGQTQQMEQRGELLLGYTRIEKIDSGIETYAYTLKSRLADEKHRYETYFVSLAPDKSEYVVFKFTIDEEDYNKQPFFEEFVKSFGKMSHPEAASAGESADASKENTTAPAATSATPNDENGKAVEPAASTSP